ncbi:NUDIX domain-containing protein [Streptococcus merionis]|uniref:NUDIX domain-containing protein n=1 Tax=Streptococcus merionis TaxID=400065 RepID=UPI0026F02CA7|nr:NUDIX domain-containing protein [Streptococcus merionis]
MELHFGVKALIVNEAGRFLAMHKKGQNELPGGRMTFGETIEEALVRELMEETGLSVTPIKVLNTGIT